MHILYTKPLITHRPDFRRNFTSEEHMAYTFFIDIAKNAPKIANKNSNFDQPISSRQPIMEYCLAHNTDVGVLLSFCNF